MNRAANRARNTSSRRPTRDPRAVSQTGVIRRPESLPLLTAICKRLNQRVNYDDEQRVLALYERGWIFNGVLETLQGQEARYVRNLAQRYDSWIARQVA